MVFRLSKQIRQNTDQTATFLTSLIDIRSHRLTEGTHEKMMIYLRVNIFLPSMEEKKSIKIVV
jgi:hypothetical protein